MMHSTMKNEGRFLLAQVVSRLKPLLLAVVIFIGAGAFIPAAAQTGSHRISGQVLSNGESVIGASVFIKGTTVGTVTDMDGNYVISVNPDDVLTVSAIGYETLEVPVQGRSVVNVTLTEANTLLSDAVVVGYGVQKKVNLTGAVASVSTQELEGKPINNVLEGLQGTTRDPARFLDSGRCPVDERPWL